MTQWNTIEPISYSPSYSPTLQTIEPPKTKPQPPETIHGAFWRYVVYLGIFGGMGRMGEVIPDHALSIFVSSSGNIIFFFFLACMVYEWYHTERKWRLHEAMERAKLPKEPKTPSTTEIHNHFTTAGGVKTTISTYETDKLPPKEFIEWLFRSAGSDGRIPSERAIRESEWSQSAFNDWLDTMDKESITVKIDARPNAARKIQGTLEDALKHFNLSPTLAPDITQK